MKAYIEIVELSVKDVITTSTTTIIPPTVWGDGNTTPPTNPD